MGNKMDLVQKGIELFVSLGVTTLVGGAIRLATPAKLGTIKRIGVALASVVISSMAIERSTTYVEKQFEEVKKLFKKKPKEELKEETIKVEEV